MSPLPKPVHERYEAKVDRSAGPDACHPWTGALYRKGYGQFWVGKGEKVVASKYALERKLGRALLPGMVAGHSCDNPPCQNPDHLYERTHKSNAAEKIERGRHGSHRRKLTAADVVAIRHAVADGMKVAAAAVQYGMSSDAIYSLVWGKTWPNAGGPITRHIERRKAA